MSTITLPNIRVSSDLTIRLKLKDGGVAIDWSTLQNIRVSLYADDQRSMASRCSVSIDEEDSTLLVCTYAANKPQYLGVNRIVISAKYMGETKTYDKPAFSFVRWTADQEGEQITIDDPDIDVEISVEDVSSSILQEAVDAAFTAADRANDAAEAAEHMVDIHTGPEGKSAYEVAVEEGYTGTEEEWLASLKGPVGETPDISIGTVTTVEPGTPAAASMSGTPEAPVLNLSIPKGLVGATPNFTVGTVTTGEPGSSVIVTITGTPEAPVLNLTIPQGMQGNTGSSVEYPYELVNNLTTNDATKGLSAAQGYVLDGKVSQLRQKVIELGGGTFTPTLNIEQGVINSTTGEDASSTTRLRTSNFVTADSIGIITSGSKVAVMAYKEDGTFVSGSDWITTSTTISIEGATKYRFVFSKADNSTITPSEFSYLGISILASMDGELASKQLLEHEIAQTRKELYVKIDISGLTQWHRIILANGKWQSYGSGYLSVDVPIIPGEKYLVQAKTTYGVVALLKSETYTSGTSPDYCTGYSDRIVIQAGKSYLFTAPEDAAFLYMTIQSDGSNLDTEVDGHFLSSTIEAVKNTEAPICVCRYDRQALNPNGLYNNSYISITRRFNSSYDSVLLFGNKDAAAVTNKFWDLFGLYMISRLQDMVSYPPDVISLGEVVAASTTSDSILPIIVGAVDNIDGDNQSLWFTGQNHAYGNLAAGVSRTMREVSCDVSVDGKPVGIGTLAVRGKVCTIEVVNMVQGFNTIKEDGTGREIIKQKISVFCSNDKCSVRVEYLALEDVIFYNIPGFGMYGNPNTGRKFRLIGSLTKPGEYEYDGTQVSPSPTDNKVNAIQFSRNGMALEVRMKNVGLGNMLLNATENNAYSTNANKVYTRLTASDTEFQLPEGGLLAYEFDLDAVDNVIEAS